MSHPTPIEELGDARLLAIEWDDADLLLRFRLPDRRLYAIRLVYACEVSISLDFERLAGPALVWENSMEQQSSGMLRVVIDFGGTPDGYISCTCNDVVALAEL